FRSVTDPIGVAAAAPKRPAYRWSSDRPPKTKPSAASWCCGGSSRLSAKLGADRPHTANASALATHTPAAGHSVGRRSHPANGRRRDTVGKPLRWRISTGTRARFSETVAAARPNTSTCGLLKQPYKQKAANDLPRKAMIPQHVHRLRLPA